ncbi:hypothetical protein D3C78_1518490 [compost metagenome]
MQLTAGAQHQHLQPLEVAAPGRIAPIGQTRQLGVEHHQLPLLLLPARQVLQGLSTRRQPARAAYLLPVAPQGRILRHHQYR